MAASTSKTTDTTNHAVIIPRYLDEGKLSTSYPVQQRCQYLITRGPRIGTKCDHKAVFGQNRCLKGEQLPVVLKDGYRTGMVCKKKLFLVLFIVYTIRSTKVVKLLRPNIWLLLLPGSPTKND